MGRSGPSEAQVVRRARVHEAPDRLDARHARRDEDRRDDRQPGPALGALGAQPEGDPQRERGRRVAEVVDEVGQQGDAPGRDEDERLRDRRGAQDREGERHRAHAGARAFDRLVDEAVRVAVGGGEGLAHPPQATSVAGGCRSGTCV